MVEVVRKKGDLSPSVAKEKCKNESFHLPISFLLPKRRDIEKNCSRLCRKKPCFNVIIIPHYIVQGSGDFIVKMPFTPFISTRTSEQVTLIAFLTDIASTLGFWLGLSAIGTAEMMIQYARLIGRYFTKRRGRRRTWATSMIVQNFGVESRLGDLESKFREVENELRELRQSTRQIDNRLIDTQHNMARDITQIMQTLAENAINR
jgi:hypothetical protein